MSLPQDVLEAAQVARLSLPVFQRLQSSRVAIAGLGGLGSHVAVMLTRAGLGALSLIDFDRVDVSNMHRQAYSLPHIGQPKVQALASLLRDINPYVNLELIEQRVTPDNVLALLSQHHYVCEAFDHAESKAMLINALLPACPHMHIVAASGMAGYGPANDVVTREVFSRLTLCGDGVSDLADNLPILASRVTLCAAHQAHCMIRLLLNPS